MAQKWNLQDIKPAEPRKKPRQQAAQASQSTDAVAKTSATKATKSKKKQGSRKGGKRFVIIAAALVVIGGFLISVFTSGAEVFVYPRHREPNLNATFTASLAATQDNLPYEVMTLEAEGERQVTASGEEEVSTQAEGTITIYNNHQAAPLRLVTNTRFESESGLVFRIRNSAVVPGYTENENGEQVPGSTTAEVFADEPGEEYNLTSTNFTIPGFSGGPEFDNVYAQSDSQFTGGFDGPRFVVDEEELSTAQQALRTELRNSLLERIEDERPAGFIAFPGSVSFTYESLPSVQYGEDTVTIKERVYLRLPLFNETDFASFIATATVPGYEDNPVKIEDTNLIDFNYASATTSATDISSLESFDFTLQGRPLLVWTFDRSALVNNLLGKERTALSSVLGAYPAIESAEATIRPFWKQTFPSDPSDITVTEVIE